MSAVGPAGSPSTSHVSLVFICPRSCGWSASWLGFIHSGSVREEWDGRVLIADTECAVHASAFCACPRYFKALASNMSFVRHKEVYAAAAEALGLVLRRLAEGESVSAGRLGVNIPPHL